MAKKTVKEQLDILNAGHAGAWVSPDGAHALTKVTKDGESFAFNPSSGIIVKVFFNQVNGEIKLYPALMFEDAIGQ